MTRPQAMIHCPELMIKYKPKKLIIRQFTFHALHTVFLTEVKAHFVTPGRSGSSIRSRPPLKKQ